MSLKILFSFCGIIQLVNSLTNLYPTTISDLKDLKEICSKNRVGGVEEAINQCKDCLEKIYENPRSMANTSGTDSSLLECRDPRNYRACYSIVAKKVNQCVSGRGDTVQKIQNAIYHQLCMDGGSVLKILKKPKDNDCKANYNIDKCTSKDQMDSWKSLDVCRSFDAFRRCQEAALQPCKDDKLTKLLIEYYRRAEKSLNCFPQESAPFSHPALELIRIQNQCQEKGIDNILEINVNARKCIKQKLGNSLGMDGSIQSNCQSILDAHKCWDPVVEKINECIPQRGTTVGIIYNTTLEVSCRNAKGRTPEENYCEPLYRTVACNATEDIFSPDLCTSFKSQRKCEESALAECGNIPQDRMDNILRDLDEAEMSLKCRAGSIVSGFRVAFLIISFQLTTRFIC